MCVCVKIRMLFSMSIEDMASQTICTNFMFCAFLSLYFCSFFLFLLRILIFSSVCLSLISPPRSNVSPPCSVKTSLTQQCSVYLSLEHLKSFHLTIEHRVIFSIAFQFIWGYYWKSEILRKNSPLFLPYA